MIIPDKNISIIEGAIKPWSGKGKDYYLQALEGLAKHNKMSLKLPWNKLNESQKNDILYGTENENINIKYTQNSETININKPFIGVIPSLKKRLIESNDPWFREEITKYQSIENCITCSGFRLNQQALSVKINGLHIGEVTEFTIDNMHKWINNISSSLTTQLKKLQIHNKRNIK